MDQLLRMFVDIFPFSFSINPTAVSGVSLWALSLYLAFSSFNEWIAKQLVRWFNFAERSFYFSQEEFEKTRKGRESQNEFWASIFSVIPFLAIGALAHYGVTLGLGVSWSISLGIICAIASGVYELGRRDSESPKSE